MQKAKSIFNTRALVFILQREALHNHRGNQTEGFATDILESLPRIPFLRARNQPKLRKRKRNTSNKFTKSFVSSIECEWKDVHVGQ
jgi:hypothetical protein